MADAYEGIITPYNTEEFEAIADSIRAHFNANGSALQNVGADLKRLLPKAKNIARGRAWALGADVQIAAWQIARQFGQADAAQRASAAAVTRAHQIYYGTFHNPHVSSGGGRTFDAG